MIFNPTMDKINVVIKKTRQKVAGSLNKIIPTKTLPTAPIPVQTAYAVPIGNSLVAFTNSIILIERHNKKPPYQNKEVFPVDSFAFPKQVAKPTSNKPAIISKIQFMCLMVNMNCELSFRIHNSQLLKFLIIMMPFFIAI